MLLGPVFRAELLRTARQRRYYVLRVAYGLLLLLMLWGSYRNLIVDLRMRIDARPVAGGRILDYRPAAGSDVGGLSLWEGREVFLSIADTAEFAIKTFRSFALTQLVVLLVLVPPLFAGTIADEKQRKTLHYLMASELSGGEIVFDKLAARLLHVGVFVALGLPVLSFVMLFGGVAPELIATAYLVTTSSVFFAAALAVWVSTGARRVRQAVLLAYLFEAAWLFGPVFLLYVLPMVFPAQASGIDRIGPWALLITPMWIVAKVISFPPMGALVGIASSPNGLPVALPRLITATVALQVGLGLILLVSAMARLRPTFRRQEGRARRLNWFGDRVRRPRLLARPACGGDAVLWKECHFTRPDLFTKLVVLPAAVIATWFLFVWLRIDQSALNAFGDLCVFGYRGFPESDGVRDFNHDLRPVTTYWAGLWLLAVAGASASGVTVEREQDTWTSLIATPLAGRSILWGKVLGAVWGLRGFGAFLVLLWLAGLITGAVHPVGFLTGVGTLAVLTWFVAALGTYASLTSRSTSRALARTLGVLILLNGGYLIVLAPFGLVPTWAKWTCTPLLVSNALLSFKTSPGTGTRSGRRGGWAGWSDRRVGPPTRSSFRPRSPR